MKMKSLLELLRNDPVKGCEVYKNEGCAHVDGLLCDFPECSIRQEYASLLYPGSSIQSSENRESE